MNSGKKRRENVGRPAGRLPNGNSSNDLGKDQMVRLSHKGTVFNNSIKIVDTAYRILTILYVFGHCLVCFLFVIVIIIIAAWITGSKGEK